MKNMIDINLNALLRQYRSHPYEEFRVETPHTGIITFRVKDGEMVSGPSGAWKERPGTLLFLLEREKNIKKITAMMGGEVTGVRLDLDGRFVEAGEPVLSLQHRLRREEIIQKILTKVLYMMPAPERARYFLAPEIETRLEKGQDVSVEPGDEILIMSLMKRDTIVHYDGPSGVIYSTGFSSGDLKEQGDPLLGVCRPEQLRYVQRMIQRIRTEWEE